MPPPLSQYDFFVIIFTCGDLSIQELKQECQVENWAPVLVVKTPKGTMVPLFRDPKDCAKFIHRNVPKDQIVGIMGMSEVDTKKFTDKGWEIEWHTYPKAYKSRPGHEVSVEVIESDFELYVKGRR